MVRAPAATGGGCGPASATSSSRDWVCRVNGERLFLKGTNYGPTRAAIAEATADEIGRDVDLMVEAGLDLVRVHGHIGRPELYDAPTAPGLLVWQDLPLQWGYARSVKAQAVRQAERGGQAARPPPVDRGVVRAQRADRGRHRAGPHRRRQARSAGSGCDCWRARSCRRGTGASSTTRSSGPSRRPTAPGPVVAHSGVLPHPPLLDGTDSHLYFGWYWGDPAQLPGFLAAWPRLGALRQRVRGPGRARGRGVLRARALAGARLGHAWAARHGAPAPVLRPHGSPRRLRYLRRVAGGDPALPGRADQAPRRDAAPAEVPADGRVRPVPAGRRPARRVAGRCSATTGRPRRDSPPWPRPAGRSSSSPTGRRPRWRPGDRLAADVHVVSDLRHPIADATVVGPAPLDRR